MASSKSENKEKHSNKIRSADKQTEDALLILKDLNAILARPELKEFGFLTYLLRMAVLEAQAIASGTTDEQAGGAPPYSGHR